MSTLPQELKTYNLQLGSTCHGPDPTHVFSLSWVPESSQHLHYPHLQRRPQSNLGLEYKRRAHRGHALAELLLHYWPWITAHVQFPLDSSPK